MRVTIIANGSRGDVQPYVALGSGLRQAGHTVRLVTSEDFRELVEAHHLEFFDTGGSVESVAQGLEGTLEGGNFLKILAAMGPPAQRLVARAAAAGLEACKGSDRIVAGLGGLFVGVALSEKLGIPLVPAYLYPITPTSEFPTILSPSPKLRLPPQANRLSHRIAQQMMWQAFRAADNKARRQVLGVPPARFWGPFRSLEKGAKAILCGYSEHVIPIPQDWSDSIHVTGYWFLEPSQRWEPPLDLLRFLGSGQRPIYIGFGSMVNRQPEEVTSLVLRALERSGQRAVVSAGWGGMRTQGLPQTVCMIGSLPHSWLFPQMAAVVHHGGVGTTAAGFRAGVPAVVTPYFGDQPFWAQRVYELGVGPRPIPRRALDPELLAAAIHVAVSDPDMKARAARLGAQVREEDGVARAVEVLEHS